VERRPEAQAPRVIRTVVDRVAMAEAR